jgi:hypothetical protein
MLDDAQSEVRFQCYISRAFGQRKSETNLTTSFGQRKSETNLTTSLVTNSQETHMIFRKRLLGAMALTMLVAGCGSYYQVRDPASSTQYYTTDVDKAGSAGAVKFKDAKTGSEITLQSSEVKEISKEDYNKGLTAPAAKPAAAAATPAPAAAAPAVPVAAADPAPAAAPATKSQ